MVRMIDSKTGHVPQTPDEHREALATLAELRKWRGQVLAERDGRFFTGAADLIRELREEQDRDD